MCSDTKNTGLLQMVHAVHASPFLNHRLTQLQQNRTEHVSSVLFRNNGLLHAEPTTRMQLWPCCATPWNEVTASDCLHTSTTPHGAPHICRNLPDTQFKPGIKPLVDKYAHGTWIAAYTSNLLENNLIIHEALVSYFADRDFMQSAHPLELVMEIYSIVFTVPWCWQHTCFSRWTLIPC